jgi:hypothetical protein
MEHVEVVLLFLLVAVAAFTWLAQALDVPWCRPGHATAAGHRRGSGGQRPSGRHRRGHAPIGRDPAVRGRRRRRSSPSRIHVALEHLRDPDLVIGVTRVANQALCASAANRRTWGAGLHHILDARTGIPVRDTIASWVVADNTVLADGLQGLTLPVLIRALGVHDDDKAEREELLTRKAATRAALDRIEQLRNEGWTREANVDRPRAIYEFRYRRHAQAPARSTPRTRTSTSARAYQRMVRDLVRTHTTRSCTCATRDRSPTRSCTHSRQNSTSKTSGSRFSSAPHRRYSTSSSPGGR